MREAKREIEARWLRYITKDSHERMRRIKNLYSGNVVHDSRQICCPIVDSLRFFPELKAERKRLQEILTRASAQNCEQIKIETLNIMEEIKKVVNRLLPQKGVAQEGRGGDFRTVD